MPVSRKCPQTKMCGKKTNFASDRSILSAVTRDVEEASKIKDNSVHWCLLIMQLLYGHQIW